MRVGIVGILHESNTFIDWPTSFDQFEADVCVDGEAVRDAFEHSPHEVGGFFAGLESEGIEAVPIGVCRATPFGIMTSSCAEVLRLTLAFQTLAATNVDGVLAAAHGAACAESHRDFDGYWLGQLRSWIGRDRPLIATLDLHANLSQQMVDAVDALIGYRSNPHIDQRERGIEAARLIARTLRGEVKPTMAAAFPARGDQHRRATHFRAALRSTVRFGGRPTA